MDLRWQEYDANSWDNPPGCHPDDPDPRSFRPQSRGHAPHLEAPRRRITGNDGIELLPNSLKNPSYPPGFDNGRRSPVVFDDVRVSPPDIECGYRSASGFDNNHIHRSGFDNRSWSGFDNGHNFHGERMFQESPKISSDRPFPRQSRAPHVSNSSDDVPRGDDQSAKALEASSKSLAHEETKKRKKLGREGDTQVTEKPAISDEYDRTTKLCHKLWRDLDLAIQQRERDLREQEERFTPSSINREALEEENKQTAAMKNDVMEERRRLEEEGQRVRTERDAMERTSTELAVQMVELKQVQRQLAKEKAALLARKAELSAKERCFLEGNRGAVPRTIPKAATEVVSNRNWKLVKADGVVPER